MKSCTEYILPCVGICWVETPEIAILGPLSDKVDCGNPDCRPYQTQHAVSSRLASLPQVLQYSRVAVYGFLKGKLPLCQVAGVPGNLLQIRMIQRPDDILGNAFGRVVFHDESVFAVF